MLDSHLVQTKDSQQKEVTLFGFRSTQPTSKEMWLYIHNNYWVKDSSHKMYSTSHFIYPPRHMNAYRDSKEIDQNVNSDHVRNDCSSL